MATTTTLNIVADRNLAPQSITAWQANPLRLIFALPSGQTYSGPVHCELRKINDTTETGLLARVSVASPSGTSATIDFTSPQMNQPVFGELTDYSLFYYEQVSGAHTTFWEGRLSLRADESNATVTAQPPTPPAALATSQELAALAVRVGVLEAGGGGGTVNVASPVTGTGASGTPVTLETAFVTKVNAADTHRLITSGNPHGTTAAQVGAPTVSEMHSADTAAIAAHMSDVNPHGCAMPIDIENLTQDITSLSEALAGTVVTEKIIVGGGTLPASAVASFSGASNKGLMLPLVDTGNIVTPVEGMVVYDNTSFVKALCVRDNANWRKVLMDGVPQTITTSGAASSSPLRFTGTVFSGGTGTTTVPHVLFQPNGVSNATTWSTGGTVIGMNMPAGFAASFFDFRINNTQIAQMFHLGLRLWGEGLMVFDGAVPAANFSTYHLKMRSTHPVQWTNGGYTGTVDTGLYRDSQGVLKVVGGNGSFGAGLGFFCDEFRRRGSGSPEGVVAAPVGAIYHRTDGGAGTAVYHKESGGSGNTGWVAK